MKRIVNLLALGVLALGVRAQTSALAPVPLQQPLNNNGAIISGGCLYTYAAGTTTPATTYSDSGLTTPNTNPIVLNGFGRAPAIYIGADSFKFVLANKFLGSCPGTPGTVIWSQDNITDSGLALKAALATAAGAGTIGFSQSSSYSAGTVGEKLQQIVAVTDAPYNAKCDGATDDHAALQAALSSGSSVLFPQGKTCLTSVTLQPAADGQIISGGQSGGLSTGTAAIKATGSISGPVLAMTYNRTTVRDLVIDGNSGAATYGITAECANKGLISGVQVRNTQSDALRITNTDAAFSGCADGPNNNNLLVENSVFTGSRAGRGIHITGLSGDANNNLIQFNSLRVNNNFQDGICGHGSQNQINGGDWSSNGANTGSTQYYAIKLTQCGETSEVQGAQNWIVVSPDPEASNFNTSTNLFRGPTIYYGTGSSANTLVIAGNVGDVCNDPGCSYYSSGSDIFVLTNTGGITRVVGTGSSAVSSECIYDHYSSVINPKWCIQGSGPGGEVLTAAIASGGTGWKPGDRATITQGGSSGTAVVRITAVTGSAATSVSLVGGQQGYGYATASGLATSAFGGSSGSGLTLNITAGYTGGYRPIAAALANSNGGIVITDSNGELSQKTNTFVTAGANSGNNVPIGTQHVTVDATSASVGLFLPSGPVAGETHTITMTATAAGHFVTIAAQGSAPANNINLSSGGVTTLTGILNRAGDSVTLRYNGITGWDVLPGNGTMPGLTSSAGSGGLYVCVDSNGNIYKKSACP